MARCSSRRAALTVTAATLAGLVYARSATAEIGNLEVIAPANPGGGYDQLARVTQQM